MKVDKSQTPGQYTKNMLSKKTNEDRNQNAPDPRNPNENQDDLNPEIPAESPDLVDPGIDITIYSQNGNAYTRHLQKGRDKKSIKVSNTRLS